MKKKLISFTKTERAQFFTMLAVALLIILAFASAVFFIWRYFFAGKENNYLIKNDYYGFEMSVPEKWFAEKNTSYSQDNIKQLLEQCKNDNSREAPAYKIGAVRFENQKYPDGFGTAGYFPAGFASGAILEITVDCIPAAVKGRIINYGYSSLKMGGEKAFVTFLNLPGFGKTKYLSFYHNGLQYSIDEYVYVSPADRSKDKELRSGYEGVFNKIISSFKFK